MARNGSTPKKIINGSKLDVRNKVDFDNDANPTKQQP